MEQALDKRTFVLAVCFVVLASCVVALWIGLRLGGVRATLWVDDGSTPLAAGLACFACLRARARHVGRMRLFWSLLCCATASWTVAEVIWGVYALILDELVPSPSWADLGYLMAIPLTVAALLAHPAFRGNGTRKARSVLDGLVVATALLFLSWTLVLGPLWRSTDLSTSAGIVTLAYPFGDVVILFFVVLTARAMSGGDRRSLWCLVAGLSALALSDSTYSYLTEIASYSSSSGNVIDAGWIVAYLGIALAAFSSSGHSVGTLKLDTPKPSLASLIFPLAVVLIALIVAALEIKLGDHLDHAAWWSVFALIALVLVRQGLAIVEILTPASEGPSSVTQRLTDAALSRPAVGHGSGTR